MKHDPLGQTLITAHIYAPPLKNFRRFVPRPQIVKAAAESTRPLATPAVSHEPATVVVVGGGFSGSLTAAQLLRRAAEARTNVRVVDDYAP